VTRPSKRLFTQALCVAVMAVALAGCPKGYGITCPTIKKYSDEFIARAETQYAMIEKQAPDVITMIDDYGVERDAIRKCIALQMADRKKNKK